MNNLSEEEKKAIEDIKNIVTDLEDAESGAIISLQQDEIDSLRILAELIKKQQKEIERLKKHFEMATRIIEGYADEVEKDTLKIENYRHKNIK